MRCKCTILYVWKHVSRVFKPWLQSYIQFSCQLMDPGSNFGMYIFVASYIVDDTMHSELSRTFQPSQLHVFQ